MIAPTLPMGKIRPRLLMTAGVGLVVAIVAGVMARDSWAIACRFAVFACLAPAVGSLLFALIHELTGGEWGRALRPFLAAGSRVAPWIWLVSLPLLLFFTAPQAAWPHYGSRGMLALRGAAYAGLLFFFSRPLSRPESTGAAWVGPAGFIVLVFMLHLLAEDWLGSLDSGWHSTAFPLVWMTGLCVSGFACALLCALVCGASPRPALTGPRAPGIDWGNLMLATMLFWCYVAFAQFLIIWAGNLPAEISWFQKRTRAGWGVVPPLLGAIHFILPMAILLSRAVKLSAAMLIGVAVTLMVAQTVYVAWIVLPADPALGPAGFALAAALLVAGGALFARFYLTAGFRHFGSQ